MSVSQPTFDAERAAAGYADAPSARAIYGWLRMPWDEIKLIALDPKRNVSSSQAAKNRVLARKLSPAEVHFALNRVAREIGARTFGFFDYARPRLKLIAADKKRCGEEGLLEELLPTAHQIITQCSTWNEALDIAGLQLYTQVAGKKAISIGEAYDLLIDLTAAAPNRIALDDLRARHGVSVEKLPRKEDWDAFDSDYRAKRAERGLETPTAVLSKADRQAIEIPEEVLAALPRTRDKGYWTYERCLRALIESLQTPGAEPSLRSYQTLSNGKGDWPASKRDHAARRVEHDGRRRPLPAPDRRDPPARPDQTEGCRSGLLSRPLERVIV